MDNYLKGISEWIRVQSWEKAEFLVDKIDEVIKKETDKFRPEIRREIQRVKMTCKQGTPADKKMALESQKVRHRRALIALQLKITFWDELNNNEVARPDPGEDEHKAPQRQQHNNVENRGQVEGQVNQVEHKAPQRQQHNNVENRGQVEHKARQVKGRAPRRRQVKARAQGQFEGQCEGQVNPGQCEGQANPGQTNPGQCDVMMEYENLTQEFDDKMHI